MQMIFSSASKIVFILIAIALVAGLFTAVIDPKDFIVIASMVFTYYFTKGTVPTISK